MKLLFTQLRAELAVIARNGEQLLVVIGIPTVLLVFFSNIDVLPTNGQNAIDFLLPGIIALAVMSTAMVSLGIATGFERSYSVLKRLGATPLGTSRLVLAKSLAVGVVEVAQCAVLIVIGLLLGLDTTLTSWGQGLIALILGTLAFAGLGLLMAGTLKAEVNLAAQNGVYVLFVLFGGIIIPLESLPNPIRIAGSVIPSGALADVLRQAFTGSGSHPQLSWIILCLWAVVAPLLAARWFRWQ